MGANIDRLLKQLVDNAPDAIIISDQEGIIRFWNSGTEQMFGHTAKEANAALGFAGALGAYGGFFIPKSFGTSIAMTGGPEAALYRFIDFYVLCIIMVKWFYSRKNVEMPC